MLHFATLISAANFSNNAETIRKDTNRFRTLFVSFFLSDSADIIKGYENTTGVHLQFTRCISVVFFFYLYNILFLLNKKDTKRIRNIFVRFVSFSDFSGGAYA